MAQALGCDVIQAAKRIDNVPIWIHGNCIAGKVSIEQVVGDRNRGIKGSREFLVVLHRLAHGTGQSVFVACLGVKKDWEVGADTFESSSNHVGWCRTDDDIVAVSRLAKHQQIADRASYEKSLHLLSCWVKVGHLENSRSRQIQTLEFP